VITELDPWQATRTGSGRVCTQLSARLAQRESASFTPKRSLVRSQYRAPSSTSPRAATGRGALISGPLRLRGIVPCRVCAGMADEACSVHLGRAALHHCGRHCCYSWATAGRGSSARARRSARVRRGARSGAQPAELHAVDEQSRRTQELILGPGEPLPSLCDHNGRTFHPIFGRTGRVVRPNGRPHYVLHQRRAAGSCDGATATPAGIR
jgi:hypothetical protein